ncbi:MAG: hypothetical protein QF394_00870 [Rhodospirillales bacterium]|nr:hypothetical protein [Rhodospirillales bacterium]
MDLLEKIDAVDGNIRSPATTYMRSLDGVIVPGLNFHPPVAGKDETTADDKIKARILRLAELGQQRYLKIVITDFATNEKMEEETLKLNQVKKFAPFLARNAGANFIFDSIPTFPRRPLNENPSFIAGPVLGNPDIFFCRVLEARLRQMTTGNTNSYLYGIVAQGFDGVILDGLDTVKFLEAG